MAHFIYITYALSNKMKHIENNPAVAHSWRMVYGTWEGYQFRIFRKKEIVGSPGIEKCIF